MSNDRSNKELYYHLPDYDYILYGIKLFIRGNMSLHALDEFIQYVFLKSMEYRNKIISLCGVHSIRVIIQSPFDNVFGLSGKGRTTEAILQTLNLSENESRYSTMTSQQKDRCEFELTCLILKRLQENNYDHLHRKLWSSILSVLCTDNHSGLNTIEQLFQMANALMISVASTGNKKNQTCSLLPLTEKQIQVSYSQISEQFSKRDGDQNELPVAFNITFLDQAIGYSPNSNGSLFYFDTCKESLSELLRHKHIMQEAYKNLCLFANPASVKSSIELNPVALSSVLSQPA